MKLTDNPSGISFLVCTYNGAARLAETLSCLARQLTLPDIEWEVILVDNASTDGTTELAQKLWADLGVPVPLHLLRESRPGKQYALETAVNQVRYGYTCIVDDDNRLAADYMRVGWEILEAQPQVGVLGGANTATFEGQEPPWFATFQHCYAVGPQLDRIGGGFIPLADGNTGRNVLWGAGMFVRTALWYKLRELGFQSLFSGRQGEANLTAGEDDELCYVAQLVGYEVWYSSRLRLQHHMSAGRLTETYRDRLFYGSSYTTARLNAYRNALWGKPAAVRTNLLKDTSYVVVDLIKKIVAPAHPVDVTSRRLASMSKQHSLLATKDILINYRKVKAYYEQVVRLKHQLSISFPPINLR